jgi:hypothetical protein
LPGRTKDSVKAFGKLTEVVDGQLRIVGDPPLIVPIEDVHSEHVDQMEEFEGPDRREKRGSEPPAGDDPGVARS